MLPAPAPPPSADYKEHHTDVSVKFVIKLTPEKMREALGLGLHNKFKLSSKISIGACFAKGRALFSSMATTGCALLPGRLGQLSAQDVLLWVRPAAAGATFGQGLGFGAASALE